MRINKETNVVIDLVDEVTQYATTLSKTRSHYAIKLFTKRFLGSVVKIARKSVKGNRRSIAC